MEFCLGHLWFMRLKEIFAVMSQTSLSVSFQFSFCKIELFKLWLLDSKIVFLKCNFFFYNFKTGKHPTAATIWLRVGKGLFYF